MSTPMNNQQYLWRGKREEALAFLDAARLKKELTFDELAQRIDVNKIWLASAFKGQQWVPEQYAEKIAKELGVSKEEAAVLSEHPYKGNVDPILYRLHEVIDTYGPAIKEIIHEEFGDGNGIMSAIDFELDVAKKEHPSGDRIIITFNGKFLPYSSHGKYPW